MEELDYLPYLSAVHLNDSVYPTGSFRDRHARIGKGMIGDEAFYELLRTPQLQGMPIVLETARESSGGHRDEIRHVRHLATNWQA